VSQKSNYPGYNKNQQTHGFCISLVIVALHHTIIRNPLMEFLVIVHLKYSGGTMNLLPGIIGQACLSSWSRMARFATPQNL
jgi:hypothetical protein